VEINARNIDACRPYQRELEGGPRPHYFDRPVFVFEVLVPGDTALQEINENIGRMFSAVSTASVQPFGWAARICSAGSRKLGVVLRGGRFISI
jgi:hypothetical protein